MEVVFDSEFEDMTGGEEPEDAPKEQENEQDENEEESKDGDEADDSYYVAERKFTVQILKV